MSDLRLLAAVRLEDADRAFFGLNSSDVSLTMVDSLEEAGQRVHAGGADVLVLDCGLPGVFDYVARLRAEQPRLLIVLVDEDADYALPGQADEVSTADWASGDALRRARRAWSDRKMETLRADLMPPVRDLTRLLRKARSNEERAQAAVDACIQSGWAYAAAYLLQGEPPVLGRAAHAGDMGLAAPSVALPDSPIARVMAGERLEGPGQAAVAIGAPPTLGVLLAVKAGDPPAEPDLLRLELIAAQLARATRAGG